MLFHCLRPVLIFLPTARYIATKHGVVGFTKSLKLAEKYEGVKVVTICPGAVDTPLWEEERRKQVNFSSVESLRPDEVAKVMIELAQEGKYKGGTVLEVMANNGPKTRIIPEWRIDPPEGAKSSAGDFSKDIRAPHKLTRKQVEV
jgi:hypothetical protein